MKNAFIVLAVMIFLSACENTTISSGDNVLFAIDGDGRLHNHPLEDHEHSSSHDHPAGEYHYLSDH